jgi:hypothetical protein
MTSRSLAAALVLALAVPLSLGAATAPALAAPASTTPTATTPTAPDVPTTTVRPRALPDGGDPTAPWVDVRAQVVHDGDRAVTLTPPLTDQRLVQVWRAGSGYVARSSGGTVFGVAADGTRTPLAAQSDHAPVVEDSGQRIAVLDAPAGTTLEIQVVRTVDGVVEARLPVNALDLVDFTDGVVTFEARHLAGGGYSRLSTWRVGEATYRLGPRRLADPALVDVDAGLMSRTLSTSLQRVVVVPLRRGDDQHRWTVPGDGLVAVSPNGRRAVTYTRTTADASHGLGTLVVRNARTGRAQRAFRIESGGVSGWESSRSLVVSAYEPRKGGYALVRLDLRTGRAQRLSGYSLNDADRLITQR